MLLVTGILLGSGLLIIAFQAFALSSLLSSILSGSPPTSASSASSFSSILTAGGLGVAAIGVAVLLAGPGNFLPYLQKSKTAKEYAGGGLIVAGRVILGVAVLLSALFIGSVAGDITASSSNSTAPSVGFPALQFSIGSILLCLFVGSVLGVIGRSLLSELRARERRIPRKEMFQRIAVYTRVADRVLLTIGIILVVLAFFIFLSGDLIDAGNLFGDGFLLFAGWGFVSGASEMFHVFAYAIQPVVGPNAPFPGPAGFST